jgi:hypothetical protein
MHHTVGVYWTTALLGGRRVLRLRARKVQAALIEFMKLFIMPVKINGAYQPQLVVAQEIRVVQL